MHRMFGTSTTDDKSLTYSLIIAVSALAPIISRAHHLPRPPKIQVRFNFFILWQANPFYGITSFGKLVVACSTFDGATLTPEG
jgi:hypothetical protein